ncbi:MAG: hypothetical protein KBH06_13335 [Spirochaetes bacterium]|nr:hypothetical protein [Spirochaetota bacterium]
MKKIIITKVAIIENGKLGLFLPKSDPFYEFIYREASGVYWDNKLFCFKSTEPDKWNYKKWYQHMVGVIKSGLDITLEINDKTEFEPSDECFKNEILKANILVKKWLTSLK